MKDLSCAIESPKRRSKKSGEKGEGDRKRSGSKKVKCKNGHALKRCNKAQHMCDECRGLGTYARCPEGCDYDLCAQCYAKKGGSVPKSVRGSPSLLGRLPPYHGTELSW